MKRFVALVLALTLAATLVACSNGDNKNEQNPPAENTPAIKVDDATSSDVESATFDKPTKITAAIASCDTLAPYQMGAITRDFLLYEPLWAIGEDLATLEGVIAKEWTINGDTVDVEIYDYVTDSEGNAITASDVVFSFNTCMASGAFFKRYFDSIEQTGEYSVKIKYTCDVYPVLLASTVRVNIVDEDTYDADRFVNDPVGTGHYVVKEFTAGQSVVVEKRDDYWQTDESLVNYCYVANADVVELDVITESAQIQNGLETGNLQIGAVTANIKADIEAKDKGLAVTTRYGKYNHQLMLNCYQGVLSESKELRQAVCYAIDSAALAYACTGGTGSVTYCEGMGPNIAGYQESWETEDYYNYNVEKAKELVKAAGYDPAGTGITLKWLGKNSEDCKTCSETIQAFLRQIGIEMQIENLDNTTYMARRNAYDESAWDLAFTDGVPKGNYILGVSSSIDITAYEKGNAYGGTNEEIQALLQEGMYNLTDETCDAIHQLLKEECGLYGLYLDYDFWGHDANISLVTGNDGEVSVGASVIAADYNVFAG